MEVLRWLAVFAFCVLSVPSLASAQDVARARALFEAGIAAAHDERWEEARVAFLESLSIAERPSTLVNLAGAEAQTGHLVEGVEHYQRFLVLATGRHDAALRHEAETALSALEGRVPHATISIRGAASGDDVRLDASVLPAAALGVPAPLNPGSHLLLVLRNGGEVARRTFELHEGESLDVRVAVVLRAAAAVAEDTPAEVVLAPAPAAAGGVDDGVWIGLGVGLGAVVVAGIVIGVVFATTPSAPMPYQGNFGDGIVRF